MTRLFFRSATTVRAVVQYDKRRKIKMMISTRGRYALRVMIDLAGCESTGYVPMKEIAKRQDISLKYLEQILPVLVKNGMLEGVHGKNGGYRLTKAPSEYRVGDILRLAEGDLAPVACVGCTTESCKRSSDCITLPMWKEFYRMTNEYFDSISLSDLLKK